MSKIFTVQIEVRAHIAETLFGTSLVKGLQDGDIHALSFLQHNILNVEVLPYEEQPREWAVLLVKEGSDFQTEWGYRGKQDDILDATHAAHPGCSIVGWFPKPE